MKTSYLAALLYLFGASAALAESGVLVDHVPTGAQPAIVIAIVKQALLNRHWTIKAVDATSIDAVIEHSNNDARLRITFSKWRLLYEGSSIQSIATGNGPTRQIIRRAGIVPERWIEYLRRDVSTALATIPESPQ
ncbi:MAG TPA: hypothetical protein VK641_10265 [Terriglobales bacterium]|nr:hypothetical protein [Terriglobales bacterium]